MDTIVQITKVLAELPKERQDQVLDYILFIQQRPINSSSTEKKTLKSHPAFGSWKKREIDSLEYQRNLRAEWRS